MAFLNMEMDFLGFSLRLGQWSLVVLVFVAITAAVFFHHFFITPPYPEGVDLIREKPGAKRFSLRTRLAYYIDCEALYAEAWHNYSKKGKIVIVPAIGFRSYIFMPPSLWKWANSLPEDQLDVKKAQLEFHNIDYSLGAKFITDGWQGHLVKTDLTPRVDEIAPMLWDELAFAVDRRLGTTPGEWVEVDATDFVTDIITRAMSRFIVNLPLCRDEEYLAAARAGSDAFILAGAANAAVSPLLRPISGFFTRIYSRRVLSRLKKAWEPVYRERMERIEKGEHTDEPFDYLQAILKYGFAHRRSDICSFDDTSRRMTLVNFSTMHTTTITTLNLLLDLIGSDRSHQTLAQLREEATRVLGPHPSAHSFSRGAVARLVKADSAAREAMRLRSFGAHVNFRHVRPRGGLSVPVPIPTTISDGTANGTTDADGRSGLGSRTVVIPQGMMLSWGSMAVARDEEVYEDPLSYDPFRFWRIREAASASATASASKDGQGQGQGSREALSSFVATSLTHMPFGHGKHACPGRFLIDVELKMVMAYLVMHYDLAFPEEYGGKRPENRWLAEGEMPPVGARIRARRR